MYLQNESLINRIREISAEAARRSKGQIGFEEHIALPEYGQIILRFSLETKTVSPDELDRWEALLYEIVGDEFLVDFMGSVYEKAGVDLHAAEHYFAAMADRYAGEELTPSVHAAGIREDAVYLLKKAGLSADTSVWEIQVDGSELLLLIFGKSGKPVRAVEEQPGLLVGEVDETACLGLFKAALYAKRNHISLARVLLAEDGVS